MRFITMRRTARLMLAAAILSVGLLGNLAATGHAHAQISCSRVGCSSDVTRGGHN